MLNKKARLRQDAGLVMKLNPAVFYFPKQLVAQASSLCAQARGLCHQYHLPRET
jgi:hypothetical protein